MPAIPAIWEAKVGRSLEIKSSRPAWPTWQKPISTKNTKKISWAWWHAPVIPATKELEAGELLEPTRQKLQWAEIMPFHSSLGDRGTPYFKRKKKKQKVRRGQKQFGAWRRRQGIQKREVIFLDPWGIATLSFTMGEVIYITTNSVKAFLFLHILSSICCLQIF